MSYVWIVTENYPIDQYERTGLDPIIDLNPVFLTKEKAETYVERRKEIATGIVQDYLKREKKKNVSVLNKEREEEEESILLQFGNQGDYISDLAWADNFCEFWRVWNGKSSVSNYILEGFLTYCYGVEKWSCKVDRRTIYDS